MGIFFVSIHFLKTCCQFLFLETLTKLKKIENMQECYEIRTSYVGIYVVYKYLECFVTQTKFFICKQSLTIYLNLACSFLQHDDLESTHILNNYQLQLFTLRNANVQCFIIHICLSLYQANYTGTGLIPFPHMVYLIFL